MSKLSTNSRGQTRERRPLVAVRSEPEGHLRERLAALGRRLERQRDGEIRPLGEVVGLGEEVVDDVRERGVRWTEAGGGKSPSAPVTSAATTEGIMGQTPDDARDRLRAAASNGCLDWVA